jgi:lipopolysaccharide transport system ATP-binding protein
MSDIAIQAENISKFYRLGVIGTDTLAQDLSRWWALLRGKSDPTLRVGQVPSVSRTNDSIWALKDVSFDVKQGEVLGIIGRNGAGKSTLLKILSRVTAPTTGECRIKGRIASLLEVGTGFHPELTGRENIFLNGAILGMTKDEIRRKFDEIVAFSEVEKYIDTPVKRYSSGMYVRLAFAVAAHLESEILIVDEVLAVGDADFQKKSLGKMDNVAREGRTILFVSHSMVAVSNLCSRTILFDHGEILHQGPTNETITHYLAEANQTALISQLKDRTDRKGLGGLRFQDTWLEDQYGNRVISAVSGAPLKIVVTYETCHDVPIKNFKVSFSINTLLNIPVTDLSNIYTGQYFSDGIPTQGRFECIINKLPLNAGSYFYNVFAMSSRGIEDWVQQAGILNVERGDFYGTGNLPESSRLLIIEHSWRVYPS